MMMTAKQAKNFMQAYRDDYIKGQLKFINCKIIEAIQNGEDNIYIDEFIDKKIEVALKNLGYNVTKGHSFSIPYTRISWGD